MRQMGKAHTIIAVAVLEVKWSLGRTKHIQKNNIKTDHKKSLHHEKEWAVTFTQQTFKIGWRLNLNLYKYYVCKWG